LENLLLLFLVDAGIADHSVIERAAVQSDGLGIFVRSLVGLDKAAAQDAFSAFIDGKLFNADQLQFVKMIIDYLTERGAVPASVLYESPFTNTTPQGPPCVRVVVRCSIFL
jgi:type I restriction enzyme R subunit